MHVNGNDSRNKFGYTDLRSNLFLQIIDFAASFSSAGSTGAGAAEMPNNYFLMIYTCSTAVQ